MSKHLIPQPMDLFSAEYTSTPFAATDAADSRYYATEKQMRRDSKNRTASLFTLDRATGDWNSMER